MITMGRDTIMVTRHPTILVAGMDRISSRYLPIRPSPPFFLVFFCRSVSWAVNRRMGGFDMQSFGDSLAERMILK
jgi:hypothetical protein